MKCPCPKCDAIIEVSEQETSANGSSGRCPECNDKYWTQREEYTQRAYKKLGRIYCCDCGAELGYDMLCTGCGSICPDYCVVQATKPVARKQQKAGFSFSLTRSDKPARRESPSLDFPDRQVKDVSARPNSSKLLAYVATGVLLLVLAGGLTKVYLEHKASQQYSKDFIVALYGIKSGTDMSMGHLAGLSAEWQKAAESSSLAPRPKQADLDKVAAVKVRIGEAMGKLNEAPEKFAEARNNLIRLHGVYEKIVALNIAAPGSLESLNGSTQKLEAEFFKVAEELRKTMPDDLQEELKVSVVKFRNLSFMVKG